MKNDTYKVEWGNPTGITADYLLYLISLYQDEVEATGLPRPVAPVVFENRIFHSKGWYPKRIPPQVMTTKSGGGGRRLGSPYLIGPRHAQVGDNFAPFHARLYFKTTPAFRAWAWRRFKLTIP